MGLTAAGTVLMLTLAYIAQSPRLLKRLGLSGARLDLRARALTGYALALILLSAGFFLAGVPLETENTPAEEGQSSVAVEETEAQDELAGPVSTVEPTLEAAVPTADDGTPDSGAFGGPPPSALTATAAAVEASIVPDEDGTAVATETSLPSSTPTPTPTQTVTPSVTPSPTPTTTPTPTNTPTPIFEETANINTGSSTLWLKRTPGGQDFILVRGGDTVILLPGHANVAGVLWREVSTTSGSVGWVLESFLGSGEDEGATGTGT